jgi:hypothetical protein
MAFGPVGAVVGALAGGLMGGSAEKKQKRAMKRIMDERRKIKANKIKYAKDAARDTNLDNMAMTNALIKGQGGKGAQTGSTGAFMRGLYDQQAGANRDTQRQLMKDLSAAQSYEVYGNQDPSEMAAQDGAAMANNFASIASLAKGAMGIMGGSAGLGIGSDSAGGILGNNSVGGSYRAPSDTKPGMNIGNSTAPMGPGI